MACGLWLAAFGFRLSAFGFRLSASGRLGLRLSAFGFRVSAFGFRPACGLRLSASGFCLSAFGVGVWLVACELRLSASVPAILCLTLKIGSRKAKAANRKSKTEFESCPVLVLGERNGQFNDGFCTALDRTSKHTKKMFDSLYHEMTMISGYQTHVLKKCNYIYI